MQSVFVQTAFKIVSVFFFFTFTMVCLWKNFPLFILIMRIFLSSVIKMFPPFSIKMLSFFLCFFSNYTHTYVYMYIYVYIYVYMYIYISFRLSILQASLSLLIMLIFVS
jgi:hypothetical protein